ncbi:2OG-Fe dioxygenase family protein [Cognatilysobacter tabacisoli]|uniref:2OG-Fe dioxygenase family protein n=1 Tax=Cognatilysobacter tabacisoli TaxID=2315424 RepID=UPI000E6B2E7E|nr:2OG-Fe dioxygenase family protein [Lysobacter tabacisoli]
MTSSVESGTAALRARLMREGFAHVDHAEMRALVTSCGSLDDWDAFADSWNRLQPDAYLAALGRHRRRRHAVFEATGAALVRAPHQPHYQAVANNPLQGGIERWFEPVEDAAASSRCLRSILAFAQTLFGAMSPEVGIWRVEVHQFRIEASPDHPGEPTPEGLHRDGVDYVLVLMVDRHNIASGTTSIHDLEGRMLGSFTLARPLESALVVDRRVYHGVTAVEPLDPTREAHRDVLVVTFKADA